MVVCHSIINLYMFGRGFATLSYVFVPLSHPSLTKFCIFAREIDFFSSLTMFGVKMKYLFNRTYLNSYITYYICYNNITKGRGVQ